MDAERTKVIINNIRRQYKRAKGNSHIKLAYVVSQYFGYGMTTAKEICEKHGFDPGEPMNNHAKLIY